MSKNTGKGSILRTKNKVLVHSHYQNKRAPITYESIRTVSEKIFKKECIKLESLIVHLMKDSELRKINKIFLGHDYNTDVITFPYSFEEAVEGEVLISLDSVKNNSMEYGVKFRDEFKRVLIHGCLHLCGFDDRSKKQTELIRKKENYYLNIL